MWKLQSLVKAPCITCSPNTTKFISVSTVEAHALNGGKKIFPEFCFKVIWMFFDLMFLLFFYAVSDVLGAHWSVALVRQSCVDRNYSFHFGCIRSLKNFISSYSLCWTTSFWRIRFISSAFVWYIFIGLGGFEKNVFFFFQKISIY